MEYLTDVVRESFVPELVSFIQETLTTPKPTQEYSLNMAQTIASVFTTCNVIDDSFFEAISSFLYKVKESNEECKEAIEAIIQSLIQKAAFQAL